MTLNWGHKLLFVFVVFGALMFTLVYKCMHTNFDLVTKEYYKDELVYQKVIDGTNNANALSTITSVTVSGEEVTLQLPKEMQGQKLTGNIWFYFPSNAGNDRRYELKPDAAGKQSFNLNAFGAGHYRVKVQWEAEGRQYYSEQSLTIQ